MTSLFAVATLISSCTKDVEPEADNAAATIVTRAAGDTPAPTAYIEVNDTNPLNVLMYRNADNTPFFKITKVFAANINDNGSEPCLYLNDNVTKVLVPSAGSTTTGHYKYVQPIVGARQGTALHPRQPQGCRSRQPDGSQSGEVRRDSGLGCRRVPARWHRLRRRMVQVWRKLQFPLVSIRVIQRSGVKTARETRCTFPQ